MEPILFFVVILGIFYANSLYSTYYLAYHKLCLYLMIPVKRDLLDDTVAKGSSINDVTALAGRGL